MMDWCYKVSNDGITPTLCDTLCFGLELTTIPAQRACFMYSYKHIKYLDMTSGSTHDKWPVNSGKQTPDAHNSFRCEHTGNCFLTTCVRASSTAPCQHRRLVLASSNRPDELHTLSQSACFL